VRLIFEVVERGRGKSGGVRDALSPAFSVDYDSVKISRNGQISCCFKRAHVSGHASGRELEELISKIAPKTLIPIHTQNHRAFEGIAKRIWKKYRKRIAVRKPVVGAPISV